MKTSITFATDDEVEDFTGMVAYGGTGLYVTLRTGENMSTWHGGAGRSWWTERHQPGPGKENLIAHCSEQTFPCYLIHGSASSAMVGCHLAPCRAHWQLLLFLPVPFQSRSLPVPDRVSG